MGFSKKTGKGRLDKYYFLAKEQGYRARSAFKLVQLHKKYNFLDQARVLIDLCAAPGGWLQVAAKYMPSSNIIVGVDLVPIKPINGVKTIVADITTEKCRSELRKELKSWKADVVLHDGAPNVGRAWIHDAYSQSELVLHSLKLATEFLSKGGVFVSKVFRSKDYHSLMWVFNQLFSKVEATKPASSRDVSAEIFVVCKGYKAPEYIDPRLLDPKFALDEIASTKEKKSDLNQVQKAKRNRDGYEENKTLLFKELPLKDYVTSEDPVSSLVNHNKISVTKEDPYSQYLTPDVSVLLEDLKVLGRGDYEKIIKWRRKVRKATGLEAETLPKESAEEKISIEDELELLAKKHLKSQKKEKRKALEKKAKLRMRMDLKMDNAGDVAEDMHDNQLLYGAKTMAVKEMTYKEDPASSTHDSSATDEEAEAFYRNPIFGALRDEPEETYESSKKKTEKLKKAAKESASPKAAKDNDIIFVKGDDDSQLNSSDLKSSLLTPEGMSLAQALISDRKKKSKELIDQTFNRYSFPDDASLPKWFAEDEEMHNKPQIPITKEGILALKEKLKVLDLKPIKKELEAKDRNKKRMIRKLESLKRRAAVIFDSEETSEKQKSEKLSKLINKSVKPQKKEVKLVVARGRFRGVKGRPQGVRGHYKMVDSRMKKEIRAAKSKSKR